MQRLNFSLKIKRLFYLYLKTVVTNVGNLHPKNTDHFISTVLLTFQCPDNLEPPSVWSWALLPYARGQGHRSSHLQNKHLHELTNITEDYNRQFL